MNNGNETLGLRVITVEPQNGSTGNSIHSVISVTFSSNISPATLTKNIVLLEDTQGTYTGAESLQDYSKFSITRGSISYSDRTLTFTPKEALKVNTKYIIVLNDGITDITGKRLAKKFSASFATSSTKENPKLMFIEPNVGAIVGDVPEFIWERQECAFFDFQISKKNTFEILTLEESIPYQYNLSDQEDNSLVRFEPSLIISEGTYYYRAKADNGQWSDIREFYYKESFDGIVAKEDQSELINLKEFLNDIKDPIEVLETYPPDGKLEFKTNQKVFVKLNGEIHYEDIDFSKCYVYGEPFDENEEIGHEEVFGKWSVIYDPYNDCTFIIFSPNASGLNEGADSVAEPDEELSNQTSEEASSISSIEEQSEII